MYFVGRADQQLHRLVAHNPFYFGPHFRHAVNNKFNLKLHDILSDYSSNAYKTVLVR